MPTSAAELRFHLGHDRLGTVLGVQPPSQFGRLALHEDGSASFTEKPRRTEDVVNGGFFFFRRGFLDYLSTADGCVLEQEPLQRLTREGQLQVFRHGGLLVLRRHVARPRGGAGPVGGRHRALEGLSGVDMRLISRPLPGMLVLQTEPRADARGSFARCFCRAELAALGLDPGIAQANLSFSAQAGTLRGLHYQLAPSAETKIVTCLQGALHDVVLDLRPASPTYGRHAGDRADAAATGASSSCPKAARTAS